MAKQTDRVPAHLAGVENARPYGLGGNVPADAVVTTYSVHGKGVRAPGYAEAPFVEDYNDRLTCSGTRTNGHPCKAKAKPGEAYCLDHDPNG